MSREVPTRWAELGFELADKIPNAKGVLRYRRRIRTSPGDVVLIRAPHHDGRFKYWQGFSHIEWFDTEDELYGYVMSQILQDRI